MATDRRPRLPLLMDLYGERPDARAPRMDEARRRLGGRASTTAAAGSVVTLDGVPGRGPRALGVLLFASEHEADVWLDGATVRRTRAARVAPYAGEVPESVARVAADARIFAGLAEGARVLYQDPTGAVTHGLLLEKCRYGALVARDDGTVMAVGFRRLWPVVADAALS